MGVQVIGWRCLHLTTVQLFFRAKLYGAESIGSDPTGAACYGSGTVRHRSALQQSRTSNNADFPKCVGQGPQDAGNSFQMRFPGHQCRNGVQEARK